MAKSKRTPARVPTPSLDDLEAVFHRLTALYGDPRTELLYKDPFQLLIAVILSAQCTDARVNQTTPALFAQYPTAKAMAQAESRSIEALIHSCGFYRQKTKSLISASKDLVEKFDGSVPSTLGELIKLRGVGRKTASVVLNQAFDLPAIAVDTHVRRVSQRLGWAHSADPKKIEFALMELLPKPRWASVNGLLILHGRRLCKARKPLCEHCPLRPYCAYYADIRATP